MQNETVQPARPEKTKLLLIASAVVIVLLALVAGFFIVQYLNNQKSSGAVSAQTTKRVVGEVGKLYNLPNEEPTVAQVKDKSKLQDQVYFKDAADGDYLLIYTNAKLAILYRESANKLINVGPITVAAQQAAAASTSAQASTSKATVKVVNGTTKAGLAASTGATLTNKLGDQVTVDGTYGDAKVKTYKKTLVVAINSTKSDVAKKVADTLGGTVGSLPAGETSPSDDILVVVGQ